MHEPVNLIDPVLESPSVILLVIVVGIIGLSGTSRETIGTVMDARNVNEREVEHQDGQDPAIDRGAWGDIWVRQHSFDVLRVDLYDQVPTPDEI